MLHCGRKVHHCQGWLAKKSLPFTCVQKLEEVWVRWSTPKPRVGFVCSSIASEAGGGGGLQLLTQHLLNMLEG